MRRDAERNRERILAVAQELFAERGADTSFDEIARAAGVGVGTVYRHYPTKDALLDELFAATIEDLATYAEAALAEGDSWAAFTGFLERLAEEFATKRALEDVILHPERGEQRIARARDRLAVPVLAIVERAKADGQLPYGFEPEDVGMIHTMLAAVIRESPESPDRWRRAFTVVVDGLAARAAADRAGPRPAAS